jgi:hypothetical protein
MHGQLAPAHRDGDGWFIPVRTLLEARLFHSPPKVAPKGKRQAANRASRWVRSRGKKFVKEERDGARWRDCAGRRTATEVEAPAESGRECNKKCSTTEKTDEDQRVCEGFKADAPDFKFSNEPQAVGAPGWSEGWRGGGGRGAGGVCRSVGPEYPDGSARTRNLGKGESV